MDRAQNRPVLWTLSVIAALCAINFYICRELWFIEYSSHMESIEAAFIGISTYILHHGLHLDWFPLWYGGIPFQNTYPPLLHALVALTAYVFGISPARAHHIDTAAFYCLGPIAVYFLALRLSVDRWIALASGLIYSLYTPCAMISRTVRTWMPSAWDPVRLFTLVNFGEGPHVASLALIPLAILTLDWAVEKFSFTSSFCARAFLAAAVCAAAVLTNWLGAFALALAALSYVLAYGVSRGVWLRQTATVLVSAVLAYALACPWIPPSTIERVSYNAQNVVGHYPMGTRQLFYAIPLLLLLGALAWVLRKTRASVYVAFAGFFAFLMAAIVMTADYANVNLMPQALRYIVEADLGVDLVCAAGLVFLIRRLRRPYSVTAIVVLVVLFSLQLKHARHGARRVMGAADIRTTVEYEAAHWLRDRMPGKRIFAAGSTQFWLNAFAETPQIGGGFDQGIVNSQIPNVRFAIPWTLNDGADRAIWLQLYGANAVFVSGAHGRDSFRDWRDPDKFKDVLPELFRDGDDAIYGVPLRSDSLAHVIESSQAISPSPTNNVDFTSVRVLGTALDDRALPGADFHWVDHNIASIHTAMRPNQLLFVQVSYHKGWHAEANGRICPIRKDGLGLMVLAPNCDGDCAVRMAYDGGTEMTVAKTLSRSSLLFGALAMAAAVFQRWRKRRANAASITA